MTSVEKIIIIIIIINTVMHDCMQKVVTAGAVDRLTDVSKFTGSHKERFTEDGKGKGIAGRRDVVDSSGYVSGFKSTPTGKAPASPAPKPPNDD